MSTLKTSFTENLFHKLYIRRIPGKCNDMHVVPIEKFEAMTKFLIEFPVFSRFDFNIKSQKMLGWFQ